jgi:hypothetical protein
MNLCTRMIVSFFLVAFLGGLTAAPPEREESEKKEPLKFDILFEKTAFRFGEPVKCKMSLTNTGEKPLTVNKRFLVNWPFPSPHEVYFVIKDAKDRRLIFQFFIRAFDPKADDFTTLSPGESVAYGLFEPSDYDLSEAYDLKKTGTYTIYAVYENLAVPEGMDVWIGRIESETVKITIE